MPGNGKRFGSRGAFANLTFAAVVISAYISAFGQPGLLTDWRRAALSVALGAVFVLVGIPGYAYCERIGSRLAIGAYLFFQLALGALIIYLNELAGGFWLLLLPLVSQAIVALPRRPALAYLLLLALAFMATLVLLTGWSAALRNGLGFVAAILFVAVFTDIAINEERARGEVEHLAAELTDANRRLSEYALQVEELATAKERNRLAREIHDSLGHYLTAIHMQIEAARALASATPPPAPALQESLAKAQSLAKEGLTEVRRSVAALRISPLEGRSLSAAIGALAEECQAAGLTCSLEIAGAARPLAPAVELAFYRAAQEALTNVRKHAHAQNVAITLDYSRPDWAALTVADDGVGCAEPSGGFGLLGLRERLRQLGGQTLIASAVGQGFTLRVEAPA